MNNKTITLGLAAIIVILLAAFFITQNYIYDNGNKIENTLAGMTHAASQNDWAAAEKSLDDFYNIWTSVKYLTALNNAEQDFSDMSDAVENLRGAIEIRDQYKTIQITKQIIGHWKNFKNLVPEP